MTSIVLESRTGPDGTLHLDVPLGVDQANRSVRVVIEALPKPKTQADWAAWVKSIAGSWQGDFERPPQGDYEEREPLG
jgi:hypothetical protein